MHDSILTHLKHFLSRCWQPHRQSRAPLLLACSGGPDSKALLYLLLEAKKNFDFDFQVVHVDHGWRAESRLEAEHLQNEVKDLGLLFHLHTLENVPLKEEAARDARYRCLAQTAQEIKAQATLLAHQMEDQAETVLKRVLEGASLPACGGMKEVSSQKEMTLWRPLLAISKKKLLEWLEERKIPYFIDSTNLDPKYLRGRLRTSIIPQLEASFGKSIVKNLCLLGKRAEQIEEHLTRASQLLWGQKVADLKECEELVLEFFLKTWGQSQGLHLSREELAVLAKKVREEDPQHPLELALKIQKDYLNR